MLGKAVNFLNRMSHRSRFNQEKLLFAIVYHRYIHHNKRIPFILSANLAKYLEQPISECDWPGNPRLQSEGWWKIMLLRYALAMHYGKGKTILDGCCGIGWGAFLLDSIAFRTIAVDNNSHTINLAKNLWPGNKTEYINASVLDLPFPSSTFDLVTAMECIEHFSNDDINRYLCETARVLKPGGILIGSSAFPETAAEAVFSCAQNPYHLHINTRTEMIRRLNDCGFNKIRVFTNRIFFFARKKGDLH